MRVRAGIAALTLALLSGCASYVTSDVTAFQNWSAGDADKRFAFDPRQSNDLETNTYQRLVQEELSPHGFRLTPLAEAAYLVTLSYGTRPTTVMVPQVVSSPWGPPIGWGPWGGWGPRPFGWGPWGGWGPPVIDTPYPATDAFLTVKISQQNDGREVYRVTARHVGDDGSLPRLMPYLVRSALGDFPLPNGTVREVRIDRQKNAGVVNEVVPAGTAAAGNANERLVSPAR
ncbi:DUF4136 domain-containing protein [Chitinasiproducens palmae]|uniref:DUF4136 domain-containing protein n=1 Tax=Chitinasiproducens palmae TaxID=1770053 RepID=A0A1H2PV26_9BURK|nr:DUF4136 domain-containing protein [Chitinasiproducens palmae]SDV51112.1 protein of unknown function [Chitinasiproducens palmae]